MRAQMIVLLALYCLPPSVLANPPSALAPQNSAQREIADVLETWKASWKPAARTSIQMQCFNYNLVFEQETRSDGHLHISQNGDWFLEISPLALAGQTVSRTGVSGKPYSLHLGPKESFGWQDRAYWYANHDSRRKLIVSFPTDMKQPFSVDRFQPAVLSNHSLPSLILGPGLESPLIPADFWSSARWRILKSSNTDQIWLHGDWHTSHNQTLIYDGTWILSRSTGSTIAFRLRTSPASEMVYVLAPAKTSSDMNLFMRRREETRHYQTEIGYVRESSPMTFWEWLLPGNFQAPPADALAPENLHLPL